MPQDPLQPHNPDLEAITLNGVHHSGKLEDIHKTTEAHVVEQANTTEAVKGLEPALDAIALNTQPKEVQKVQVDGFNGPSVDEFQKSFWNMIRGPKGEQGDQGPQGPQGDPADPKEVASHLHAPVAEAIAFHPDFIERTTPVHGRDGKDGAKGDTGKDGKNGIPGTDGKDGRDGKDGKDGKDGSPDTAAQIIKKISGKFSYESLTDRPNFETYRGKGSNVAELKIKGGSTTVNQASKLTFTGATVTDLGGGEVGVTVTSTGISLTTTGTSGAATLIGSVLNVPNYSSGSGGITRSVNVVSTNTAAGATAATDYVYYVSGASTITLPTAVGNTNMYRIIRVGSSTVPIATTSAQTINGAASPLNLITQYASVDLGSDGANWFIH